MPNPAKSRPPNGNPTDAPRVDAGGARARLSVEPSETTTAVAPPAAAEEVAVSTARVAPAPQHGRSHDRDARRTGAIGAASVAPADGLPTRHAGADWRRRYGLRQWLMCQDGCAARPPRVEMPEPTTTTDHCLRCHICSYAATLVLDRGHGYT